MKSLLTKLLLVFCAVQICGAHWAVLQSVAWAGMLVTRTQQSNVATAVETTFDGEHPCQMCVAIAEGRKQEQEKFPELPALKKLELKFIAPESGALFCAVKPATDFPKVPSLFAGAFSEAPPTPPPNV